MQHEFNLPCQKCDVTVSTVKIIKFYKLPLCLYVWGKSFGNPDLKRYALFYLIQKLI